MCIVAEIWQQNGLKQDMVTRLIFKFISQALETLLPSGPRLASKTTYAPTGVPCSC